MSTQKTVLFSLMLSVTGRKTKAGISRVATIPRKLAEAYGIFPGDILTVEVTELKKGEPRPRPYRKQSKSS